MADRRRLPTQPPMASTHAVSVIRPGHAMTPAPAMTVTVRSLWPKFIRYAKLKNKLTPLRQRLTNNA